GRRLLLEDGRGGLLDAEQRTGIAARPAARGCLRRTRRQVPAVRRCAGGHLAGSARLRRTRCAAPVRGVGEDALAARRGTAAEARHPARPWQYQHALAMSSVPAQFQQWLQDFYRLPPLAPVDAFEVEVSHAGAETLLLRERGDELELGLCFDPEVLARVEARGGIRGFAWQPLEDFWTVLEGVSHFVCLGWHAANEREISALDLEVQAE